MICILKSIPHTHLQPLSIGPETDTGWRKSRWGKIEDMEASYRYLQTTLRWKKYVSYNGVESKKRCWQGNSVMNSINRFSKSSFRTSCERSLDLKCSETAQKYMLGGLWQAGLITFSIAPFNIDILLPHRPGPRVIFGRTVFNTNRSLSSCMDFRATFSLRTLVAP